MRRFIDKKNIFFLLVLIGIFGISFSVFALRPPLELNWPTSPGDIHLDNNSTLTELIAYIYEWAMAIGGIATFIALVSAGFQYLTSAGNTTKMSDAKKQITSAITGLVLLLSTFLIFSTINPELTTLEIPEITFSQSFAPEDVDSDLPNPNDPCAFVRVYSKINFSGNGEKYTEIKRGEHADIATGGEDPGIKEGQGSIKFFKDDGEEGGACKVKLYEKSNCKGDCIITIYGSTSDLNNNQNITDTFLCVSVDSIN